MVFAACPVISQESPLDKYLFYFCSSLNCTETRTLWGWTTLVVLKGKTAHLPKFVFATQLVSCETLGQSVLFLCLCYFIAKCG